MSKPISQREARRWRKRALEAEKLLRNASAIVDQEMERHWIQSWNTPEYTKLVETVARMEFRVEVELRANTDGRYLAVYAVRRRRP